MPATIVHAASGDATVMGMTSVHPIAAHWRRGRPGFLGLEDGSTMSVDLGDMKRATAAGLSAAVHRNRTFSRAGALERLFTFAFRGLVYPQIWEDPVVDMEALAIKPEDHVVAIASGGCHVMSYLVADPARIVAVDLNGAHIALNRLKLCAARQLPDFAAFHRFFGEADRAEKVEAYDRWISPHLD